MYAKSRKRKFWIPVIALVLVAVLGFGIWFGTRGGEPVNVYPFEYIGMTEFWGDAQESYGPVTTDKIQTEFLTDTQTVTEVKVQNGELVKKGDVLFSFDTTLDGLSLERKRLDVEKIKVQIKAAEERLQDTRKMVPYVPPEPEEPKPEELGEELKDKLYKISENTVYDGSKKETALICWLKDTTAITDEILQVLHQTSLDYRTENTKNQETEKQPENQESSSASGEPSDSVKNTEQKDSDEEKGIITVKYSVSGEEQASWEEIIDVREHPCNLNDAISYPYTENGKTYWLISAIRCADNRVLGEDELTIPACSQDDWGEEWEKGVELVYHREVLFEGVHIKKDKVVPIDSESLVQLQIGQKETLMIRSELHNLNKETTLTYSISPDDGFFELVPNGNDLFLTATPQKITNEPQKYELRAYYTFDSNKENRAVEEFFEFSVSVIPYAQKDDFYVVFKSTEKNFLKGNRTAWHGAKVTAFEDGSFEVTPYDASAFDDHTFPPPEKVEIDLPEIDPNEMYTAEQILDMQKQCYAIIKEQKEKLKLAESEYAIMERELGDGNVYADIDGKIVSLLTEEEAKQQKQPLVKVSGGGGFYIEGSVSELEKENLKIGQEVTINDWNSGGSYTGEVVSIGEFPSNDDNWNGMGNPTASYYPFRAFVDETADLQEGSHVSMSYSAASAEQGIYLEKAFVRTEKGSSYVFVRGSDGKLEKRNVKVGKMLWGSYYEILSGLSAEDYLAFPYGKHVTHGAPTVESDISALYTY